MNSSSTPSSCNADSRSRPCSVKAWNAEYESTSGSIPFDRTIAPFGISKSGWNRAPFVPWTQCTGHAPPNSLKCFVSRGCQSRVKITGNPRRPNRAIVRFTRGIIASPSGTPSAPPGQKSFWMSMTSSAALCPTVPTGQMSRSLKACARLNLLEILEVVVPERHVPRQAVEPARLNHFVARSEFRRLCAGDELREISMAGSATVRHGLMDDPGQSGVGELEAHLLAGLSTESVIGPLSLFEQTARRKPHTASGFPAHADQDDRTAGVVDQAAGRPERRAAGSAERGIIRRSDPGPTDDGDPPESVEGIPHPVLALSGTHRRFLD